MKKVFVIILLLVLVSACDDFKLDLEELVKAAKIYKEAELKAKFPACPPETPFRIGAVLVGPCVSMDEFEYYMKLRLSGSTSYSEMDFITTIKSQQIGQKKNCPPDKPYYVSKFLFFGGECLSQAEFEKKKEIEIDEWTQKEIEQEKHRYVESPIYCKDDFLYDTQEHRCISTDQCNDAYTYFNVDTGDCSCNEGYRMTNDGCEKEIANKQCKYDSDCGKPTCSRTYYKTVHRCNARTYKCEQETIDCREDFGSGAICGSGLCVS